MSHTKQSNEMAKTTILGLVQRGARQQQRDLCPLRAARPRRLQRDRSVYDQLEEKGWGPAAFHAGTVSHGQESAAKPESGAHSLASTAEVSHENDHNDDDAATTSRGPEKKPVKSNREVHLTQREQRHFARRHLLCPSGYWPSLAAAPKAAGLCMSQNNCTSEARSRSSAALLFRDGVCHYAPRMRASGGSRGVAGRQEAPAPRLEWLPFHSVAELPREVDAPDADPDVSPVLLRVWDEAVVRQFSGLNGPEGDGARGDGGSDGHSQNGLDDSGEGIQGEVRQEEGGGSHRLRESEVRLHDLLELSLGMLTPAMEEGSKEGDGSLENCQEPRRSGQAGGAEGTQQRHRREATRRLRECMGREVERMVDKLLGDVLAAWAERTRAHRSDEGYLAWQRCLRSGIKQRGRAPEEMVGVASQSVAVGDWHDVLGMVEEKALVEAASRKAMARERAAQGRELLQGSLEVLRRKKGARSRKRPILEEHARKVLGRLEREDEKERAERGAFVLGPVLDPGTLARARDRLERLFWAGEGAASLEESL